MESQQQLHDWLNGRAATGPSAVTIVMVLIIALSVLAGIIFTGRPFGGFVMLLGIAMFAMPAVTDCRLLAQSVADFRKLMADLPDLKAKLEATAAACNGGADPDRRCFVTWRPDRLSTLYRSSYAQAARPGGFGGARTSP